MKPIVEIIRLEENFYYGTFGVLKVNKEVVCFTLEPRDEENAKNISSIPAQQYLCAKIQHRKYGWTFQVLNVPGRSYVLFHPGNTFEDTLGCVLLGTTVFDRDGKVRGLSNSQVAFRAFKKIMKDVDMFHLTVKEEF